MRALGRGLQTLGLVLPLTGLLMSLQKGGGIDAMSYEFGLLVLGVIVFWVGLQIQKKAGE